MWRSAFCDVPVKHSQNVFPEDVRFHVETCHVALALGCVPGNQWRIRGVAFLCVDSENG